MNFRQLLGKVVSKIKTILKNRKEKNTIPEPDIKPEKEKEEEAEAFEAEEVDVHTSSAIDGIKAVLLDKQLKVHSRRHPDIRLFPVENFTDTYRFLLRICNQRLLTFRHVSGYFHCSVSLMGNEGKLELTDQVGNRKGGTIAVLKIDIDGISPQVKEIRFVTTKKNQENENDKNR